MQKKVSVIIPTLNEEETLGALLDNLSSQEGISEIIVSDCGSTDDTAKIASGYNGKVAVVQSERGRAVQMNTGASFATGDILWFLHADCTPVDDSVDLINGTLSDDRVVPDGGRWGLDGSKWYYKPFTAMAHVKNKINRNLYGDMGVFVRKEVFEQLGGFASISFLEDVEFNRRLRKAGKTVIINKIMYSSDRKLLVKGPIRTFIKNYIIKFAYILRFSPDFLKKHY